MFLNYYCKIQWVQKTEGVTFLMVPHETILPKFHLVGFRV